jgi:mannose-6-phosphate isomerase-like protein (cupin superfamily)
MPDDPSLAHLTAMGKALRTAWRAHPALTVNQASLRVVRFEGHFSQFHAHAEDECYVVLEGELLVEIEGEPARHLQRGDAYVVRAGVVHRPFATPIAIVLLVT